MRKKQITKKCKKMRRKCEKHATQPEQQKQEAKKRKNRETKRDSPLNCLEAPQKLQRSCLQGKICPLAKFSFGKICPLAKFVPLAKFAP